MTNEEFKMNMYFEKYKDYEMYSLNYFRLNFRKAEGKYNKVDDLFRKIQKYQIEKYGNVVGTGGILKINNRLISKKNSTKISRLFGTKIERRKREKEHYCNIVAKDSE